ncbi:hypothetical protein [Paenibacillus castaneae]|nr:hypothetical protein [Paenibacillus castaneae]
MEEEEYFNLQIDIKRKLIDLRKIRLESFKSNAKNGLKFRTQLIAYCRMFCKGIELKEGLSQDVITSIQSELAQMIEYIQKFGQSQQAAVTLAEKKEEQHMKVEIASLREIMESYLDELTTDPGDEAWEELEENPEYEKLVAFRQKTILRIHSEYFPVVFMLFEAPLEQCYYVIWIEASDNYVNLKGYSNPQQALLHILDFLNENEQYSIDPPVTEFTIKYHLGEQSYNEVTYYNDNRLTLAQKIDLILQ